MDQWGSDRGDRFRNSAQCLLLECDTDGNVVWMSETTRLALGPAANRINKIPWELPAASPVRTGRGNELCFTRLWERDGRVIVVACETYSVSVMESLSRVQARLLRHFLRLQAIEQNLHHRARRRHRSGANPVQQLERERQRLGAELHTSVGQLLAAIRLQLEVVACESGSQEPKVQAAMDRISRLCGEALEQVRSVSKRLHPPEWQKLKLAAAIRQLWDFSGIPERFQGHLEIRPFTDPDLDTKVFIYRAAQEGLSNVARHSGATRVKAVLEMREDKIVFRLEDDGVGFDPARLYAEPASLRAGLGLRTIREQAESLGGAVAIESGADGTTLQVAAPFLAAGE
ncbi:MAG: hypothetical protein C5B51_01240 [Terriglobia bacterium]|nr:MAG: hypothetical protein C5B51_01240 [Terriglobia bacterium]